MTKINPLIKFTNGDVSETESRLLPETLTDIRDAFAFCCVTRNN